MNLLSVNGLSKIGREKPLFTDVTFGLNEGDKAALIGRNGTGKSTLLNTIAGVLAPDSGTVVIQKEAGVSFLAQSPLYSSGDTIRAHIFNSKSQKLKTIRGYEEACEELQKTNSEQARKKYNQLSEKMDADNLWNYENQIKSILTTLGISDLERKMGELSGGMIKKVALAQVLVEDSKLILLDEPTNHLDISTILWLQNYLAETKRSVLMVTHDRYFLDSVCNNIYELARNRIKLYTGNYTSYLEKKQTESQIEANTERRIESVLRFEREWLRRGPCARGTKAKARIQRDMELINREKFSPEKNFSFEVEERRLGGKILELHGVSKQFPKGFSGSAENSAENFFPVLKNFSYTFNKGEKIGIFGGNGSGKSTLLNIITQKINPDSGEIIKGENTFIAYYEQNPNFDDTSLTVLEYIKEAADVMKMSNGTELSAALFLEQFGFEGKIQHSPVSSLSGGERKRLYLVRLLIGNPNFLILDEPTNDFDIFTMNILEQFLLSFKGCLLVVSHDRYFMDKVCDTLLIMEADGSVSGFTGKCSEYIELQRTKNEAAPNPPPEKQERVSAHQKKNRMSFKEKQEFERIERRIFELEDRKPELEKLMASSNYEESAKAGKEYTELEKELAEAYSRWEELSALE
ncbi:ABC-F family ATP-binding cassette domain-containing protein [Treponema sp.]|uniref:ABC-F family ATP-binding cassette domain-containing protein n=1 Tax=Treponema sp. TaxID=166 RepID=UPI003EFCF760